MKSLSPKVSEETVHSHMKIWKIYTNEYLLGIYVHGNISEEKIKKRSREYIKKKLAEGEKLSSIVYCYAPIYTKGLP